MNALAQIQHVFEEFEDVYFRFDLPRTENTTIEFVRKLVRISTDIRIDEILTIEADIAVSAGADLCTITGFKPLLPEGAIIDEINRRVDSGDYEGEERKELSFLLTCFTKDCSEFLFAGQCVSITVNQPTADVTSFGDSPHRTMVVAGPPNLNIVFYPLDLTAEEYERLLMKGMSVQEMVDLMNEKLNFDERRVRRGRCSN